MMEQQSKETSSDLWQAATHLADIGREFQQRGWVLGTSGNFSAVLSREPLRLLITSSGVDKGALAAANFLQVDANGVPVDGLQRPSAETALHLAVARLRGASAVLHTHSVWSTILSEAHAGQKGISIE